MNASALLIATLVAAAPPTEPVKSAWASALRADVAHHAALVDEKLSSQEKRLDAQDQRIQDLHSEMAFRANWSVGLLSILLTLVAAAAGFLAYFSAGHKAKREADEALRAAKSDFDKRIAEIHTQAREAETALREYQRQWSEGLQRLVAQQTFVSDALAKVKDVEKSVTETAGRVAEARESVTETATRARDEIEKHSHATEEHSKRVNAAMTEALEALSRNTQSGPPRKIRESTKRVLRNEAERLKQAGGAPSPASWKTANAQAFAAAAYEKYAEAADAWEKVAADPNAPQMIVAQAMHNIAISYREQKKFDEALRRVDEMIQRFRQVHEADIAHVVATAIGTKGVILTDLKRDVGSTVQELEQYAAELEAQKPTPPVDAIFTALSARATILGMSGRHDEGLAAARENVHRMQRLGAKAQEGYALNTRGFLQIQVAKSLLQSGGDGNTIRSYLSDGLRDLHASLGKVDRSKFIVLGNIGYAYFLLGDVATAERYLRDALEDGGEQAYKAEIADAQSSLPEDERFKALVEQLWREFKARTAGPKRPS